MLNSQCIKAINEIVKFAQENGGKIGRFSVVDILQTECPDIGYDRIGEAVREIENRSVYVENEETDEDYTADQVDESEFYPANVNISQINMSVSTVMERLQYEEFQLNPAFQRKGNLWSDEKQSQLIESLMLRIPLGLS